MPFDDWSNMLSHNTNTMVDNDKRFDTLIAVSNSCDRISNQLGVADQLSSSIANQYLSGLIVDVNEVESSLRQKIFAGPEYQKLLEHAPELESIVSIPIKLTQYIDDPNRFDDALDLLEYVHDLNEKYSKELPIIESIYKQSREQHSHLSINLCNHLDDLKESSKEELKKLVHQIIRCGTLSGRELRLRFLQARDYWFNNECETRAESFDELISFFCQGLPQIFEEYKCIFSDSASLANSKLMTMSSDNSNREDGAIINSWLLLKTSTFILSLEMHLKMLEHSKLLTPTMIGDTMQKCFRLTDWLASIGFDFSSQLRPLFSKSVVNEIKYCIERATIKFEAEFTKTVSKSIETLLLPVDDEILRISSMKPEEQIPKSIGHYPVFKIYCLYIIDSMRWVQATKSNLSPISLCSDVYAALNASLTRVMQAVAVALNMDNNSNHPILSKIAITFLTEVLPFMTNYCEHIFPEKVVLSALGLSKTEFKNICVHEPDKVKHFRLDLRQIGHSLRGIMPALMQTIEG